jgi:hypothetical protein
MLFHLSCTGIMQDVAACSNGTSHPSSHLHAVDARPTSTTAVKPLMKKAKVRALLEEEAPLAATAKKRMKQRVSTLGVGAATKPLTKAKVRAALEEEAPLAATANKRMKQRGSTLAVGAVTKPLKKKANVRAALEEKAPLAADANPRKRRKAVGFREEEEDEEWDDDVTGEPLKALSAHYSLTTIISHFTLYTCII